MSFLNGIGGSSNLKVSPRIGIGKPFIVNKVNPVTEPVIRPSDLQRAHSSASSLSTKTQSEIFHLKVDRYLAQNVCCRRVFFYISDIVSFCLFSRNQASVQA